MKKLIFVFVLGFILTGCGSKELMVMTCGSNYELDNAYFDSSYNVLYDDENVVSIYSIEKIVSDDVSILEGYRDQLLRNYSPYSDIEYFDYNVSIDGNTLISETDIDYSKIDVSRMVDIDYSNKDLFTNGKVNINTIKTHYEDLGIICYK